VGDVTRKLAAGEPLLLVDLRDAVEQREQPGIPGAVSMTMEELQAQAAALPQDREIVFYCACPDDASSAHATLLVRRLGVERAWALKGGMAAWHAAHQPARWVPITVEPA
jgi:rhodanese-related sulfurtransferase